jgi:putative ABC transport system substrate-binding protein
MLPNLRRVLTFYSSDNPLAGESLKIARDAARQLKIELIERPVGSVEELRTALQALQPKEADALLYIPDAMMQSQAPLVINAAMTKSLPAMFADKQSANEGALASYGVSFDAIGRVSAKYVQRVLQGAQPGELPVEQVDTPHFVINLKTAKALGLSIPQSVLTRADEVIH